MGTLKLACVVCVLSACAGDDAPNGIAFVRIVTMAGECGVADPDPLATDADDLLSLRFLPYERARAAASYQRGPAWDGHLITLGWPDGTNGVSRMFVELSPTRGYGLSQMPDTNLQAVGLVQWSGTERTFAGRAARGLITYDKELGDEMQALIAFDGVGANGESQCRVVGVHSNRDRERFEPYDPTWLAPNPSVMITVNTQPPSLAGDVAPTRNLIVPSEAPPDEWPQPPEITGSATTLVNSSNFGGGGFCD